jgi:hypothetical protein
MKSDPDLEPAMKKGRVRFEHVCQCGHRPQQWMKNMTELEGSTWYQIKRNSKTFNIISNNESRE